MPCRLLAAPHRQPQLSLWSSRLRQGVSVCYQKRQAGTGWFQPVFCGAVSLAACRLPCVGHNDLSCVGCNGLLCVGHNDLSCVGCNGLLCVGHSGLSCVRCNCFPCVRHNGLPYVRGGGLTAAYAGTALLAALAGRIGGGLPGTGGDDRRRAPGRVCCLQGIWPSGCMPLDGVRPFRSRTARSAPSTAAGNTA